MASCCIDRLISSWHLRWMKKPANSFTYRCTVCKKLSVDTGDGEGGESKCAYCFHEDAVLEKYKKKLINASERDLSIENLKVLFHRA